MKMDEANSLLCHLGESRVIVKKNLGDRVSQELFDARKLEGAIYILVKRPFSRRMPVTDNKIY